MHRTPHLRDCLLLLLLTLGAAGCGPSARMDALRPAMVPLPGIRTLAVGEFVGPFGPQARTCFLEQIRASDRFQLTSPEYAQAIVRAEVSSSLRDQRCADSRTVTENKTRTITVRDADGNVVRSYTEEVPEERQVRVSYVRRSAELDMRMHVQSGGRVLAEEMGSESLERRYGGWGCRRSGDDCDDGGEPYEEMPSGNEALAELACTVGTELATRIVPEAYTLLVDLDEDGGELVRRGAELADGDSWAAAVALWQQALAANPRNAPALYNLGVEQERRGRLVALVQAREYYLQALSIDPKRLYGDALDRIGRRIFDAEELARRMQ